MAKKETVVRGSVEQLSAALDTALDHLTAYKKRQDDIVRALGQIQRFLKNDSGAAAAREVLEDLMGRTLKQSKERVYNHALALRMAAGAVPPGATLDLIKQLAPEAFEVEPETVGQA